MSQELSYFVVVSEILQAASDAAQLTSIMAALLQSSKNKISCVLLPDVLY
jgi:hypothetical protein